MILTHHITVEYDDESQRALLRSKVCSSLYGCTQDDALGVVVADGLGRIELVAALRRLAGVVARDHQEVDGLPRAL